MSFSFDKHDADCRPLAPYRTCRAVAFLKTKLSDTELKKLDDIMRGVPVVSASLDSRIEDVMGDLSTRVLRCLEIANIQTLDDLVRQTESYLFRVPNFGRKAMREVKERLAILGHRLGELPPKSPPTS
jgi:DNA-directed RNA polymerase alpha subunit